MADDPRRQVAVIVPARNEEARIAGVLRAVLGCRLADEVIVVDDGSEDNTSQVAASFERVRVLRLSRNIGKAGAMSEGSRATKAGILAFVDADLGGLRSEHLERIIMPVLMDQCDMCVGIFRGGKPLSDAAQRVMPILSGQRTIKRELFEAVPQVNELRMGIEIALNRVAKTRRARVRKVFLRGVSNCYKEQKLGLVKGTAARLKMYGEIGHAMVKTNPRRKKMAERYARWRWRV
jgi:glycosyltransferase involved in cell wall biosynthesis